jgi:hypothetical protein
MTSKPMAKDLAGRRGQTDLEDVGVDCPGRKPPFMAVKRPARPYKSPTQNRFAAENTKAA